MHLYMRSMLKMLAEGLTVQEAWEEIARRYREDWHVRDVFAQLDRSEMSRQMRDLLFWTEEQWAQYGLPVPWGSLSGVDVIIGVE